MSLTTSTTTLLFSTWIQNVTQNVEAATSESSSALSAPYVAIIVSLIGLAGTIVVHYNVKRARVCGFEFRKKDPEEEEEHEQAQDHNNKKDQGIKDNKDDKKDNKEKIVKTKPAVSGETIV